MKLKRISFFIKYDYEGIDGKYTRGDFEMTIVSGSITGEDLILAARNKCIDILIEHSDLQIDRQNLNLTIIRLGEVDENNLLH